MNGNQIEIEAQSGGTLRVTNDEDFGAIKTFTAKEVEALRAYFQAERDKELGWWRASPDYVVKPRADNGIESRSVTVLNERLAVNIPVWEDDDIRSEYGIAARAYFDAHPEPKPWHEAKPGEAWLLTFNGLTRKPHLVSFDRKFVNDGGIVYDLDHHRITAGYRIYPAQDGDNDE